MVINLDDVVGLNELAEELGETVIQLRRWVDRSDYNGFPKPLKSLVGMRLYSRREVLSWHENYYATRKTLLKGS